MKLTTSSSVEVKNSGAIPPLPPKSSWRGASLIKHRDNVVLSLCCYKCADKGKGKCKA
jgi:hypothetical protein